MLQKKKQHNRLFSHARKVKRAFTLLEVMVAFSLVGLLLAVGLGAYREMNLLEQQADLFRGVALQRRVAQSRLSTLFLRILPAEPFVVAEKKDQPLPSRVFYLSDRTEPGLFRAGSLVFSYENGTDLIPEFCNDVIGRLYIKEAIGNPIGELWLATWPRPACSQDPLVVRHEMLLSGVKEMSWSFYEPPKEEEEEDTAPPANPANPSKDQAPTAPPPAPTPDANSWNSTWSITYGRIPAVVHLRLTFPPAKPNKPDEELDLYFPMLQLERNPTLPDSPKESSLSLTRVLNNREVTRPLGYSKLLKSPCQQCNLKQALSHVAILEL